MEAKKKKNGDYYLKKKIAELEEQIKVLKEEANDPLNYKALSEQYAKEIKSLKEDAEEDAKQYNAKCRECEDIEKKYEEEVSEHQALEESYVRLKKELNKTIDEQAKTISKLTAEKANADADAKFYEDCAKKYWAAMGWFRRWKYNRNNK